VPKGIHSGRAGVPLVGTVENGILSVEPKTAPPGRTTMTEPLAAHAISAPLPRTFDPDSLALLDREELLEILKAATAGGVALSFHGKRAAMEIARRVRPRVTRRVSELHVGSPEDQARNMLIEGENLQAMVTLYKYRGEVDLILTDPPYNTGQQFRYNDHWETDPNDPELGTLVALEDGSRHTKWMKAMMPRLQMMRSMLKPQGVIAVCIDDNELFHLGMMMDEVFGEENRLAVINWQKTYSPKNDSTHVSTATEYVLVYARDRGLARTELLDRTEAMNAKYRNPDGDQDLWRPSDLSARAHPKPEDYGIQNPFTGVFHYPPGSRRWGKKKSEIKRCLEMYGSRYSELKDPNCTLPSLAIAGSSTRNGRIHTPPKALSDARERAIAFRDSSVWPAVVFLDDGEGTPNVKRYLKDVQRGRVALTYWADEDYETPLILGPQSWNHAESGHSQAGIRELTAMVGVGHGFSTVKPMKLMTKLIQLWCPPKGLVLDPYAGSGTTGHAVLLLNSETGADRRFILIEQGRPEHGDKYARTLTWMRLRNAVTGHRPDGKGSMRLKEQPLGGGFEFRMLTMQIDAKTVLSMKRDELVDVVITSHWDSSDRNGPGLIRVDDPKYSYLVGRNEQGEGYFIIWNGDGPVGQLDLETYRQVLLEGKRAGLKTPYHVYARYEIYQTRSVIFYKIPDKILAHLGLNESSDSYNEE
jgi:adenine-specific DNA-methyltransferase